MKRISIFISRIKRYSAILHKNQTGPGLGTGGAEVFQAEETDKGNGGCLCGKNIFLSERESGNPSEI